MQARLELAEAREAEVDRRFTEARTRELDDAANRCWSISRCLEDRIYDFPSQTRADVLAKIKLFQNSDDAKCGDCPEGVLSIVNDAARLLGAAA